MTIEQVREFCHKTAEKHGYEITAPILANGRLTSTLGRVILWEDTGVEKIEFSKRLLAEASDEDIIEVILHELAHVFVWEDTWEAHGHDCLFKQKCKELGLSDDAAKATSSHEILKTEEKPKYSIYCSKEHTLLETRARACKTTRYPELYICPDCGAPITVVQNY